MSFDQFPFVSLIVPMKNECFFIEKCLQSMKNQEYSPEKFEVIVFDGLSEDDSWKLAEKYENQIKNFSLLSNPKVSQSAAWNKGIQMAKGDIIGIVSAHAELAEDYISNAVETLQRTGADLVGGPTNAIAEGDLSKAIAAALNSPFGVGDAQFHYTEKEIETDTVFMGLCWKSLYVRIGGFDEEMIRNQDDEFSYRLLKHGGRIICNPKIKSKYYSRATLNGLWKQYFQYGFYKVRVLQKHHAQMRLRQFIPFLFVLGLIFSILLTLVHPLGWIILAFVAGSYLFLNFVFSVLITMKEGRNLLFYIPLAFTIMHVGYGVGFIFGLVKFINRCGDRDGKVPKFNFS